MLALLADSLSAQTDSWSTLLSDLWQHIRWTDWRGFWLGEMAARCYAVWYFLPLLLGLLLGLLLVPQRYVRHGIILAGVIFIAYVFGLLYAFLWLLTCVAFHRLGEWFVRLAERKDIPKWWVPTAGIGLVAGYFLLIEGLGQVKLPPAWNAWVLEHAPWALPLGARGFAWEPAVAKPPIQLFEVLLEKSHDIGTAYLTMRMMSYFFELKRGTINRERRSLFNFVAYLCYIPTLIQGPLERYNEFNDQIDTCWERRTAGGLAAGLGRMLLGTVKCFASITLLGPLLVKLGLGVFQTNIIYENPEQMESYGLLFFGVHLQVLLIYLVFSGYCDIAIGMSRLLGYRAIENFRRPWLAVSLADMWRRWHISLSFMLRDYIYFPLVRRRWNNTLALLITFFVCGIWHNFNGQYAAWGLTMGLMVAVNQKWSRWMRDLDRHPQRYCSAIRRGVLKLQPLPRICSWLFTINVFVMSGWICLGGWGATAVAWELIRRPLYWLTGK